MADGDMFIDVVVGAVTSEIEEAIVLLDGDGVATLLVEDHQDLGEGELQALVEYSLAGLGFVSFTETAGHVRFAHSAATTVGFAEAASGGVTSRVSRVTDLEVSDGVLTSVGLTDSGDSDG